MKEITITIENKRDEYDFEKMTAILKRLQEEVTNLEYSVFKLIVEVDELKKEKTAENKMS